MTDDTYMREAPWMIPLLVFLVIAMVGSVVGLVIWIANSVRTDVKDRLDKQDAMQAEHGKILTAIKDLLQAEVHKLRSKWTHHEVRLQRLEERNGLPTPQRRFDDAESGD